MNGLARITPAPLDGSGETLVERIPAPATAAQGRIVADSPDGITLVVDPENAAKQLTIPRSDIEATTCSRWHQAPANKVPETTSGQRWQAGRPGLQ